ncbi:MAG: hypothetical protein JNN08_18825 [Bryobacterales bacterium]|nr:hypothetical protein [Bryobacterales bacterium]
MERLQRLQLTSDVHFQDEPTPLGALHDLKIIQRAQRDAKRNARQQASVEDFDASLLEEIRNNPDLRNRILGQRDPGPKR